MFKLKYILYITFILCIIFISCTSRTSLKIEVSPQESMFDQSVSIRILNCPANEKVKLRATMFDDDSVKWVSINTFMASNGVINLASISPISGSYDTIDAMGFISLLVKSLTISRSIFCSSVNLNSNIELGTLFIKKTPLILK